MYVLLLPAVLPLALLGTMIALSWWEDCLPPQQTEGLPAASVVVSLRPSALAEMSAVDHRPLIGGVEAHWPVRRSTARSTRRRALLRTTVKAQNGTTQLIRR